MQQPDDWVILQVPVLSVCQPEFGRCPRMCMPALLPNSADILRHSNTSVDALNSQM